MANNVRLMMETVKNPKKNIIPAFFKNSPKTLVTFFLNWHYIFIRVGEIRT
jgi:hypothetical protein